MSSEVPAEPARQVVHVPADEGIALWVPEEPPADLVDGEGPPMSSYTFMATAELTGGSLSVVNTVVPPGNGPPTHLHVDADESFYVLEGAFEVTSGGKTFVINPGDYAFIPRGTHHIWKNITDKPARMIRIYTPGGMEKFFTAISRPAKPGEPAPRLTNEDVQRAVEVATQHYGEPPAA
ncbi:MAG TPA: cupin domain-containing protein [Actinophytocola sp.]|jgi:quercetin dioxygenase-like cupin family protein|uniref:cupin domain-containing protein n=1 Tax=Actinophytocola sp. TaxID=1872138 RepID=UPI002F940B6A